MCTDVAWSRQREQIQTEEMSHILLRPEFSSPRLEAISISWPTSYKSRWQLMPTKLSHTKACFLVFSISGKNVIKTKTMKLKGIMLLVVCFFGDFFFFQQERQYLPTTSSWSGTITSVISFLPALLHHTPGILVALFLKHQVSLDFKAFIHDSI